MYANNLQITAKSAVTTASICLKWAKKDTIKVYNWYTQTFFNAELTAKYQQIGRNIAKVIYLGILLWQLFTLFIDQYIESCQQPVTVEAETVTADEDVESTAEVATPVVEAAKPIVEMNIRELRKEGSKRQIKNASRMTKAQLIQLMAA